jgi:N-acetylmuramic acid 6-phosphate etherase
MALNQRRSFSRAAVCGECHVRQRQTAITIRVFKSRDSQNMSEHSRERSEQFLKISSQFKLGALVTEASHPVTARLSEVAKTDIAEALKLLFAADADVVNTFRAFVESGRAEKIAATVLAAVRNGGRIFFTGCGSTGRLSILLDSVWRDFWQRRGADLAGAADYEQRTVSVMAGGDYALIKSVEGFEDFTAFGKKQIADLGVSARDAVFAITEGGETSFVIGTAWQGVAAGAKVYFVYNNPDEILCEHVQRSQEVIQEPRIEKINLTTGPMAITGSTRMQATSIQLCVMLTILEMAVRELAGSKSDGIPRAFLDKATTFYDSLKSPELLAQLAALVALEESVYRGGHKNNYYADRLGIDVLTDTTERSPTYCTPPFRKFDDVTAAESWAFLFLPEEGTEAAWQSILKRKPRCIEWNEEEVRALVDAEKVERTLETVAKIGPAELMRYQIGSSGLKYRVPTVRDSVIAIVSGTGGLAGATFQREQLERARRGGSPTGLIYFGRRDGFGGPEKLADHILHVPVPETDFLLDGVTRVAAKLVMNALSTCTMVRLGRVMGNYMVWVVPSNLKLIDRATRYITKLTNLDYAAANALLFEIIEYVEPRMKRDQAYPPVVGMAVLRAQENLTNEQAEARLKG